MSPLAEADDPTAPRSLRPGPEIARGGEGSVHLVPEDGGLAAKFWHVPDPAKGLKVSAMAAHPAAGRLSGIAAWPLFPLTGRRDEVVGYAMRRIVDHHGLHLLYTPKSRRQAFPAARWPFLARAAGNVARAFSCVHAEGFVIGDVNHASVLVDRRATVALVDCDSFQVESEGRLFTCDVGVDAYTPPELQAGSLSGVARTADHDGFGLAVLVFQLLFLGRHPFAGVFSGTGDMDLARAVRECRFAYVPGNEMSPPPGAMPLASVGPNLAHLFARAFSREAADGEPRPSALEWARALDTFEGDLEPCGKDADHHRLPGRACPFCDVERRTALPTFGRQEAPPPVEMPDERPALARLAGLPARASDDVLARAPDLAASGGWAPVPSDRAVRIGRRVSLAARYVDPVRWTVLALAVVAVFLSGHVPSPWMLLLGAAAFLVSPRVPRWAAARLAAPDIAAAQRMTASLAERIKAHPSGARYATLLRRAKEARKAVAAVDDERSQRLAAVAPDLDTFLNRYPVAASGIEGLGEGRLGALEYEGVETARDVNPRALQDAVGIGPVLQARLMAWRKSLEGRYRAQIASPLLRSKAAAVEAVVAGRKAEALARLDGVLDAAEEAAGGVLADGAFLEAIMPDLRALAAARCEAAAKLAVYAPTAS